MTTADAAALKTVLPTTVADLKKLMTAADMHESQAVRVADELTRRGLGLINEAERILADGFASAARLRRQVREAARTMSGVFDGDGLLWVGEFWVLQFHQEGRPIEFIEEAAPPQSILPLPRIPRCG